MAKFFSRLFSRGSSFHGSQSSLNDNQTRSKTSNSVRTSASLENLASYHVIPKELEKNKLHKASWEGNLHKVTRLARPGQINVKDQHKRTPIHLAVVKGHIEIVRYLVQENAKLDLVDNEERTPLIKAVLSGNQNPQLNYQICQVLMEGGAGDYINAVDKHGRNALHYAIDFGNQHLVELFLSNENCDPNYQDRDQMTPLHLAIKRNSPHIVQSLLSDQHEQQADPNIPNRNGQTPLHIAASVGYIDIVRLLLLSNLDEPCDPTIVDSQQLTAYASAKTNHQEACAKLIEEYQEKRYKPNIRRQTTTSITEQPSIRATNSISLVPASNLQRNNDETSDDSSSISTNKPSKSSPRRIKRSSDQWSDDNTESKRTSHGINNLFQPNKTDNPALNHLFNNNPLQTNSKKTQQTKSTSFFGIGPIAERVDSDNTSTSISMEKSAKQALQKRPDTSSNPYVNTALRPVSNTKSWSDDTITASPVKKQEPKSTNSWDTSVSDDQTSISKPKKPTSNLQKTQPFSPSTQNLASSSDTDDNSVETEIRKLDTKKPSNGTTVDNLVNKQITNGYKVIGLTNVHSPLSDDSSWTTSPVPFNEELPNKGVHNLVQKPKTDESTWDDSRPLSADLKTSKYSNDLSKEKITGVENLYKIIETIQDSHNKQTSSKVIGKLIVSSMGDRTDSALSGNTLHDDDEDSWKKNDINNLHGSIPSTKSSFKDVELNELKEQIKQLERNREDTYELKRQLKEMENRKNDFEKKYYENDQILRDIEYKLKQEKNEKQRLEQTTEDLNTELQNTKRKLQSLETDKKQLNQRCNQLEEERDNHNEKLRRLEVNNLQSTLPGSLRDEDVDKIKSRYREELKYLSTENDDLHHRTKQLQSDLQLHRESLDVTVRYKIDLEKAIEEKISFQRELDRLKQEKDFIEQEKLQYKIKYDGLQEEIRAILFDRSKLEQKLTTELQEHLQEKQRSTDDLRKYRIEIEELNLKLNDAQTRLHTLQTQNESLLTLNNNEYKILTQNLNKTEPKIEQHDPLFVLTSTPLNKTFPQQYKNENYLIENFRQIRSNTERSKFELDNLREDFDKLISNYEPINNFQQQTQIHSQIDTFRHFYEQEYRQRQFLMSNSSSSNDRKFQIPIDSNLSQQRVKTITQLPRQASALLTINTTNNGVMSSVELLRKHYHA